MKEIRPAINKYEIFLFYIKLFSTVRAASILYEKLKTSDIVLSDVPKGFEKYFPGGKKDENKKSSDTSNKPASSGPGIKLQFEFGKKSGESGNSGGGTGSGGNKQQG
jgi:hypothetical protein